MTNPAAKLREAQFFLRLLNQLEAVNVPLLAGGVRRDEFAFVLSGLLNAFYSATEHLKVNAGTEAVRSFKKHHPIIFDSRTGLRNLTVHERHVSPALTHYVPPKGNAVNLVFREKATRSTDLRFRSEYYVNTQDAAVHINSVCREQYAALIAFAASHGVLVEPPIN
jgi:hypothetical protein